MNFETKDLSPTIGTEIINVDVKSLTKDDFDFLRDLWKKRLVLVFRNQELSTEDQKKFSEGMGPLYTLPDNALNQPGVQGAYTMIISNQLIDGKKGALPDGEMWFHYDLQYTPLPAKAGVLYGQQIPSKGGNTRFSNAIAAYKRLPEELRHRLISLRAEHVYDYRTTSAKVDPVNKTMSHEHPVITQQPGTGEPVLYISRLMTSRIIGMTASESEKTLKILCDQLEDPATIYEHTWAVGDLVIWDNNACLHARTDFDPKEARKLCRMSLANIGPLTKYRG